MHIDREFNKIERPEYGDKEPGKRAPAAQNVRAAVWKMANEIVGMYGKAGKRCSLETAIEMADAMYFKGAAPTSGKKPEAKPAAKPQLTIKPDRSRGTGGGKSLTPEQERSAQVAEFSAKMKKYTAQ